ncbi:uncharacterized protein SAMN05421690_100486 [Nitrosomonas sp. Nm51]|uniref:YceD family protein n=1 Tax=Nitrosomonas sp. Nm51 TaxID=133720 RepID=UPI0008D119D9|nr:DUF177 domain-containing protein [Nitrosomonas sp. Nm51]SEQ96186.1 uncharacterized protein SAMN05421690_100486 [Nitrosomonas sp. Nm51]
MSVRFVIDALDFVRKAGKRHGKILLSDLDRVQDFLHENSGEIDYWINGDIGQDNKPYLFLRIKGEMNLSCQRCLGSLTQPLAIERSLVLVETEAELIQADEGESVDAMLAVSDMDVQNLIEEEIILSLAISSRHKEGECDIYNPKRYKTIENTDSENPFAALKKLKKV